MSRKTFLKMWTMPGLALAMVAITATPSFAQTVELAAVPGQWTPPPPGGGAPIAMWGFIPVAEAATYDCATALPSDPWAVGPTLSANAGDDLTVNVVNCLSEPVSVFIPGQLKGTVPEFFMDDAVPPRRRVRSFDVETLSGGTGSYTWTNVKEGTYLYHSGTHPQVQVQMGLYGALTVGNYGIQNEATLVYSEIDPALHAAVAGGTYGTAAYPSTFNYAPRYFLINGAAYPDTTDIVVDTITDVLLRFVNAGLKTHVPTFDGGLYMSLIAEDGNPYPFAVEQYGVELSAAKTIDAIVNVGEDGEYALYDRALNLTNGSNTGGGMLTYIQAVPAAGAPIAMGDAYATDEDIELVVTLPGVLGNDLDADGINPIPATYEASLVTGPSAGFLDLAADGSFTYTPNGNFNGTDLFSYQAVDTAPTPGPNSNVASVTITVNSVNNPPVANDDSATTPPDTPITVDVVANDTDVDGNLDPTTVSVTYPTPPLMAMGSVINHGDGTVTYTPNSGFAGTDTFVYEVCDTGDDGLGLNALCDTATATIMVMNNAPVANDDAATTQVDTPITVNVVANDTDVDGNLDPTTANTACVTGTPICSGPDNGTLVNNGDGTFTYTPNLGFAGTDTFVYEVCDTGALCDTATVTITVVSNPPVANDDFATTTRNNPGIDINVIINDSDAEGINAATVFITTGATTQRGGKVVAKVDGTVTYVPKRGFRGTDLFQYTVDDILGVTSNVATVRVNVLK